jgi:outer membrane protein assembly factor BamE (lipoprotein component of BamABCDE complex)
MNSGELWIKKNLKLRFEGLNKCVREADMLRLFLGVLIAAVFTGCSTIARFDMSNIEKINPGVTTRGQVVTLLGPPSSVSEYSDGRMILVYDYVDKFFGAEEKRSLNITITPDGKAEKTYTLDIAR